ncbi:MAG: sigma-70 family RNA polymerase sigma factor [Myxococcota bacterium]
MGLEILPLLRRSLTFGVGYQDREDLVQNAWLRLLECHADFEGRSTFKTFAVGVARMVRREAIRDDARHRALEERWSLDYAQGALGDSAAWDPFAEHSSSDTKRRLEVALAALSERDRWILRARLYDELSYDAIVPEYRARFAKPTADGNTLRKVYLVARRRLEQRLEAGR